MTSGQKRLTTAPQRATGGRNGPTYKLSDAKRADTGPATLAKTGYSV